MDNDGNENELMLRMAATARSMHAQSREAQQVAENARWDALELWIGLLRYEQNYFAEAKLRAIEAGDVEKAKLDGEAIKALETMAEQMRNEQRQGSWWGRNMHRIGMLGRLGEAVDGHSNGELQ